MIFDPGDSLTEATLKCMSCGRRKKMEEKTQRCGKCKKEFPMTSEFFHRSGDGFTIYCKPCRSEMQKANRREKFGSKPISAKRRTIHHRNPIPDSPRIPTTKATPAEILIALRKGMAEEIIAMIQEKYAL